MAEKEKNKKLLPIVAVVVVLAFVGVIYLAWNNTGSNSTNTDDTNNSETVNTSTSTADVDKLDAREVKLTPENFNQVTTGKGVVLVDMYSPTCSHCQKIAPILTDLSNEYGDRLVVAKMSVAVDANREFILNWDKNFAYVPAITIFKDGEKVESFTGERTKAEFKELIDKYLK